MSLQFPVERLSIREAESTDVDWATELIFAAGPGLFSYIFALKPEKAKAALHQAFVVPSHALSYEYTQIIEVDEQPAGLVLGYPGSVKKQAEARMQAVMANILPLKRVPRILVNLADMTRIKQDVAADSYYILSLSITPELRHKGLGTALLNDTEALAQEQNCRNVSLDVTYNNLQGKRWLSQLGYHISCSKTSHRFEQMTDAGGLHRMERSLCHA
ncbi:GNAT family N-acetyltransferase [filamentous cyanobacterium LEGE 11480]|uniref:GNAT family N-acetyltransferase n=1 Tax=Romeriopsis navalis LEGE 11480 TaxID=2777977 RepID=A0A928VL48_9CYAN|nr:GNAT family N-acetyltransferase [Romeriopsis navalis]MBE9028372.1 GNAT family N-acetyltransferase [Romeriopsis navalis LEGE 11480]